MIPNTGLTTLYALMNLTKVAKKDFDDAKPAFMTILNANAALPAEYKEFWKKLTGLSSATALLYQIINIETEESATSNLSDLYTKLTKILKLQRWVATGDEFVFDVGTKYDTSEFIKQFIPLYNQFVDDLSLSKWDLPDLNYLGNCVDYTAESKRTFETNILGGFDRGGNDEGGQDTEIYDSATITTLEAAQDIDFTFFNQLIMPLSSFLLKKGYVFNFSSSNYDFDLGQEHATFTNFLNSTTMFENIESIINRMFDPAQREKYDDFFEHLIPSFYMVSKSIEYKDQPDKNLKELFKSNESWLFRGAKWRS